MSGLVFTPIETFAAVDEPGAEPLGRAIADDGSVIAAGGLTIVYGIAGAGKTTVVDDLAFALAAGVPWLEIITCDRPLRIAMIENEGPRPEFRKKLERKLAASRPVDDRILILEEPWQEFTFALEAQRVLLAQAIETNKIDLLIAGPVASLGARGGGTPEEIEEFARLLQDLRQRCTRQFALLLVHHENRAGQISGAWERLPDTLIHVTAQGHGRTRLFWQKVRWSSALHQTSSHLLWADGDSFTVDAKPEVSEDTMVDDLLAAVTKNPGASWTKIRDHVTGNATDAAKVRDRLLRESVIINTATRDGHFNLWHCDDPAAPRSEPRTALERLPFPSPAEATDPSRSPVPYVSRNGDGNGTDQAEPEPGQDEIERPVAVYAEFES